MIGACLGLDDLGRVVLEHLALCLHRLGQRGVRDVPVRERAPPPPVQELRESLDVLRELYADLPLMFPPPEIQGKILAGGVLPKGRTYSHPADLPDELEKAGVPSQEV